MFDPKLPEAWLDYGDRAYLAARVLWFTSMMFDAPVQCHRTIELYLKTFLVAAGRRIAPGDVWGHDLDKLRGQAAEIDDSLEEPEFARRVAYFQRYFDLVRYPTDTVGKLEGDTGIWFAFDANILPLDQVVAYLRSRIAVDEGGLDLLLRRAATSPKADHQARALQHENSYLEQVLAESAVPAEDVFQTDFIYDLPGC